MSSADLTEIINDPSGLPAYQQSIQTFLKQQMSRKSSDEADEDVVELNLEEGRMDLLPTLDEPTLYHSPVYPALFLNTQAYFEYDSYCKGNTSVPDRIGTSHQEDYFTLPLSGQGKTTCIDDNYNNYNNNTNNTNNTNNQPQKAYLPFNQTNHHQINGIHTAINSTRHAKPSKVDGTAITTQLSGLIGSTSTRTEYIK
jgi:hypothetical protein